ncbi:MAG TPA: glycosyltransferase family 39 protein [Bryobacteraceae bacterium]|nr:glycosyltransferase family 39 protein [Bryobacteraceae bacterium]
MTLNPRFAANRLVGRRCQLLLVLLLALASRAVLLSVAWRSDSAALAPDSARYLSTAASLSTSGAFQQGGRPELLRTPGYPLFLAVCGVTGPLGYGTAQVVQLLLDVLLVYITYRLASRLINPTAALLAAAFQAVSVPAMLGSVRILSDGLFSLVVTAIILILVCHLRDARWWLPVAAATLTAGATYVRPVGFIFVPVVTFALLRARRFRGAIGYLLGFALLVAPWFARNQWVAGYAGFSSFADYNLLYSEAAEVRASMAGIPVEQARQELEAIYQARLQASKIEPESAEAIRLQGRMGLEVIRANPVTWAFVHLKTSAASLLPASTGILEMYGATSGGRGTLSVLHTRGPVAAAKYYFGSNPGAAILILPEALMLAAKYSACLVAILLYPWCFRKLGWDSNGLGILLLTTLAFLCVAGPAATPRFRLPVEPLLNIGAAAGAMLLTHYWKIRSALARPSQTLVAA